MQRSLVFFKDYFLFWLVLLQVESKASSIASFESQLAEYRQKSLATADEIVKLEDEIRTLNTEVSVANTEKVNLQETVNLL